MHQTTSPLLVSFGMQSMTSTTNITLTKMIVPYLKYFGSLIGPWTEQEHYRCSLGSATYANTATDNDFISTFNIAVANLAGQCAQDNAAMSKLSETNQTMKLTLNAIMQELQSIKHKMNYSNAHTPTVQDSHCPPSSIYAVPNIPSSNLPQNPTQLPFVPSLPPQNLST